MYWYCFGIALTLKVSSAVLTLKLWTKALWKYFLLCLQFVEYAKRDFIVHALLCSPRTLEILRVAQLHIQNLHHI